jgi:hypothetical protein
MFYIRIIIGGKNYEFLYATEESRQAYINKVCFSIHKDVNFLHQFGLTLDSCNENKDIPVGQPYEEIFVLGYFQGVIKVYRDVLKDWFDNYQIKKKNQNQNEYDFKIIK